MAAGLATSLAWTGDGRGGGAVAIVVSSSNSHKERHRVNLDAANRRTSDPSFVAADRLDLWLIDARSGAPHRPLDQIFTTAVKLGRRGAATALLRDLVPGFSHVEILTNADGTPIVHVVYEDRSVPVALAGDGVAALIRLSLELAARPGGVVLIEEPEVHQHPAALLRSARAIAETVKRGVQVVVSTHSLELIDALVGEECGLNLEDVALFMLRLSEGRLGSARIPGPRVAYARQELEDDLR